MHIKLDMLLQKAMCPQAPHAKHKISGTDLENVYHLFKHSRWQHIQNLELVHPVSGKRIHGRIKNGLELPLRIKSSSLECNYAPVLTKMLVGASTTAMSKLQIMNFTK